MSMPEANIRISVSSFLQGVIALKKNSQFNSKARGDSLSLSRGFCGFSLMVIRFTAPLWAVAFAHDGEQCNDQAQQKRTYDDTYNGGDHWKRDLLKCAFLVVTGGVVCLIHMRPRCLRTDV